MCQQVGGDGGIYRRDGEAAEAGFLGDDARQWLAAEAGKGGFGLLALVFEAVAGVFEVGAVLFGLTQVEA